MIKYEDLKAGMKIEALSAGEWLPATVVRVPEGAVSHMVDVQLDRGGRGSQISLDADARHHGELGVGLDLIRLEVESGGR